jgi:hypothetical protein
MLGFSAMEPATERLEDAVNALSDMDSGWWPFLFLRPQQDERMTNLRVLMLSLLYGVMGGMLANIALRITGEGDASHVHFLTFPAGATLGFFVIYRLTFALCWNRRADRLVPVRIRSAP